uniref:F5/8 type C domain-containing protein n=1 Tax=Stomoxys calcitrans TaxID=35570 RepID=A0A1I8PJ44_STOCA
MKNFTNKMSAIKFTPPRHEEHQQHQLQQKCLAEKLHCKASKAAYTTSKKDWLELFNNYNNNYLMLNPQQQLASPTLHWNYEHSSYFRFRFEIKTLSYVAASTAGTWLCILFPHFKYSSTITTTTTTAATRPNYVKNYYPIKQRHSVNNNKTLCWLTLTLILLSGIWNTTATVRAFDIAQCKHPLGMESGAIADFQISASTAHDMGNVGPQHA